MIFRVDSISMADMQQQIAEDAGYHAGVASAKKKRKQRKEEGELVNRDQIGKQQRIILNKWKQRLKKNQKVFKLKLTIDIRR